MFFDRLAVYSYSFPSAKAGVVRVIDMHNGAPNHSSQTFLMEPAKHVAKGTEAYSIGVDPYVLMDRVGSAEHSWGLLAVLNSTKGLTNTLLPGARKI